MKESTEKILGHMFVLAYVNGNGNSFPWPNAGMFERGELLRGKYLDENEDGYFLTEKGVKAGKPIAKQIIKENLETIEFRLYQLGAAVYRRNSPPPPDGDNWMDKFMGWLDGRDRDDFEHLLKEYQIVREQLTGLNNG